MSYRVRAATPADLEAIRALLPRLAEFDIPERRAPEDLWRGDEQMLLRWRDGGEPKLLAHVAEGTDGAVLGVAIARLREELLSHDPSAHLEILAVATGAEGQGIGGALTTAIEENARARGAETMTLHVFGVNTRARRLYEKLGYEGELIRYIKELPRDR